MFKKSVDLSGFISYLGKKDFYETSLPGDIIFKKTGEIMPREVSKENLLNLFATIYREHAKETIKKAASKAKSKMLAPLSKRKEKFLLEVLKKDKNIISIAANKQVALEKLAEDLRQSLDQFSELNEQLKLLVS